MAQEVSFKKAAYIAGLIVVWLKAIEIYVAVTLGTTTFSRGLAALFPQQALFMVAFAVGVAWLLTALNLDDFLLSFVGVAYMLLKQVFAIVPNGWLPVVAEAILLGLPVGVTLYYFGVVKNQLFPGVDGGR